MSLYIIEEKKKYWYAILLASQIPEGVGICLALLPRNC